MTDLFSPPTDPVGSYRDLLVGDGKKYKDDEALAKANLHGEKHITTLETELAQLRSELKTRLSLEEVVSQIKATRVDANQVDNNQSPPVNRTPSDTGINPKEISEEIRNLVKQTINQERNVDQARSNVETVRSELIKVYGDSYQEKLVAAAKELDVSKEFLASMAETNPKAFLKVVTNAVPASAPVGDRNVQAPPRNSVTPSASHLMPGTFSSYMDLQKKNPKLRYDRDFQAKLHREALADPDSFFR